MTTTLDRHAWCIDALPAFVGGTLQQGDASAVLAHAGECARCREELSFARRVQRQFAREWHSVAPLLEPQREQADFDRLWARISAGDAAVRKGRKRPPALVPLLAFAATFTFGVGLFWYRNATVPDYRTLADPAPRICGQLRVQVDPQLAAPDVARMFEGNGAQVVDGPSAEGVYTLRAADPGTSLGQLRALPGVLLAEPTGC